MEATSPPVETLTLASGRTGRTTEPLRAAASESAPLSQSKPGAPRANLLQFLERGNGLCQLLMLPPEQLHTFSSICQLSVHFRLSHLNTKLG